MFKLTATGRIASDPEVRYLPSGRPVLAFRMATNVYRGRDDSGRKEEAIFYGVNIYGQRAESLANVLKKGTWLLVEGSLRLRAYQGNDGSPQFGADLDADNIEFGPKVNRDDSPAETVGESADADLPF